MELIVQTFQQLIVIYNRGNFVYHLLGCTLMYRLLSCPFISLVIMGGLSYMDMRLAYFGCGLEWRIRSF